MSRGFVEAIAMSAAGLLVAVVIALLPFIAGAATFAYVNMSGLVITIESTSATAALSTAPFRAPTSGVMLVDDPVDQIVVGDQVPGALSGSGASEPLTSQGSVVGAQTSTITSDMNPGGELSNDMIDATTTDLMGTTSTSSNP